MVISGEDFKRMHRRDSYEKLIKERDEILNEMKEFEQKSYDPSEDFMCPSADVVYQCNFGYLHIICDIILKKYLEERDDTRNPAVIARKLLNEIYCSKGTGDETSLSELFARFYPDAEEEFDQIELIEIYRELVRQARKGGIKIVRKADASITPNTIYNRTFTIKREAAEAE